MSSEPYVIVISLDFSKAFDTVRHSSLLHKLAQLELPDNIYNWLNDFFDHHSHCTVFRDQQSSLLDITASIIQGSAVGPAAYVVTAGDQTATTSGNSLCKFADDTYLIIPASNEASRSSELANIQDWAQRNNLKLNCTKSSEVVFTDNRRSRRRAAEPAPLPGIARSRSLKMLGVVISDDFSVALFSRSARPAADDVERADTVRTACVALSRSERRGAREHLPRHRHRPADVRRQRVARVHQGVRSTTHQLYD